MTSKDIRWIQRLKSYEKALHKLKEAIEKYHTGNMNEIEKEGMIQRFEHTYELAWNTIKDYYKAQGETNIQGSKDAFRTAFNRGLIQDGEIWMEMVESRILTTHTYNDNIANLIIQHIVEKYFTLFEKLKERLHQELQKTSI